MLAGPDTARPVLIFLHWPASMPSQHALTLPAPAAALPASAGPYRRMRGRIGEEGGGSRVAAGQHQQARGLAQPAEQEAYIPNISRRPRRRHLGVGENDPAA